jgi:3-phenylpropionate/cinnamic acid dioxygenase small subunit
MTSEEACAHLEISQALYRYAQAIDGKDFSLLETVFTPDAVIHYDLPGGTRLPFPEMVAWLAQVLQIFSKTQHCVSNVLVEVSGDEANSTCYLSAAHEQIAADGGRSTFVDHGTYHDRWVRTAKGWRIRERVLRRTLLRGDIQPPRDRGGLGRAKS